VRPGNVVPHLAVGNRSRSPRGAAHPALPLTVMARRLPSPLVPQLVRRVQRPTVDTILAELRRVILSGDVPPGTVIPLAEVAHAFGVSPIPVREALKTLVGEALVEHQLNAGYRVAMLTVPELAEMYVIREGLETAALTAAITLATPADLELAEAVHQQAVLAVGRDDGAEFHRLSREFHRALSGPSRMHRLLHMLDSAWNVTEPVQPMLHVSNTSRTALHEDHAVMLQAFRARDLAALLAASTEHHRRLGEVIATLPSGTGLLSARKREP
jgi:DNA-binding GntR family transcriptional regulator